MYSAFHCIAKDIFLQIVTCVGCISRRIQAAFPNGPQLGPTGAQLGPNLAQPGPNWGPYGMLLGIQIRADLKSNFHLFLGISVTPPPPPQDHWLCIRPVYVTDH